MIIFLIDKIKADGCHMGQLDGSFTKARKKLKNKIFGITCHNSKILVKKLLNLKQIILLLVLFLNLNSNLMQKKLKLVF